MRRGISIFARRRTTRSAGLLGIVLLILVAAAAAPAQDAGVSGIPPGPANVRGLNGSINDPSGIGNAGNLPPLPMPRITPVMPPAAAPSPAYQPALVPGVIRPWPVEKTAKTKRTRHANTRARRTPERAEMRAQDRHVDHGLYSICRGC